MRGMPNLLRRVLDLASSAKVAAVLMVVLVTLTLVAVLVPQTSYMPPEAMAEFRENFPLGVGILEAMGLTSVFSGWYIAVAAALLGLNVAVCTLRRVTRHRRFAHEVRVERPCEQEVVAQLRAAGWRVIACAGGRIGAVKGRWGFWGSILLHGAILAILAGGAMSAVSSFRGELVIAEGQTIVDEEESYDRIVRMPSVGQAFSGNTLRLDSMSVHYEGGQRTSVTARMSVQGPGDRAVSTDVRVNHPLDAGGTTYLLNDSGYAPSIALIWDSGRDAKVVNLAGESDLGYADSIVLGQLRSGGGEATLDMTATPIPLPPGVVLPVERFEIKDPRLQVRVFDSLGVLADATLARGQSVELGPGLALTFEDLLLWNSYIVRRDPARWLVYVGFWMVVSGTAWRFLVPEKRISVSVDDHGVSARYRVWPVAFFENGEDAALLDRLNTRV